MNRANEIEEQAAVWLVKLDAQGSPEKWAALDAWLAQSPRHRAAFLRLSVAWRRTDQLRRVRPIDPHVDPDLLSPHARPATRRRRWLRPGWAIGTAAAAAIALLAIAVANYSTAPAGRAEIYATQIDKPREEIILQDGTKVVLNTNSEVRVSFTPTHREVKLVRGEALFQVAHNVQRPFDVVAGIATVRAVGTAFSVRVRDRTYVDVLVTEGRVMLNPPSNTTLGAGQGARLVRSQVEAVWAIDDADRDRSLAWVHGRLEFDGRQTLSQAVDEVNRYTSRHIVIADPEIGARRVSGVFEVLKPDEFIRAVEAAYGLRARSTDSILGRRVIRLEEREAPMKSSD